MKNTNTAEGATTITISSILLFITLGTTTIIAAYGYDADTVCLLNPSMCAPAGQME